MAQTLLELTTSIVSSHASVTEMSSEDLLKEIQSVYAALQKLEVIVPEEVEEIAPAEIKIPTMSLKKAFQADQVFCMICGKGGMKTLSRHLNKVHNIKPGAYRKQFNIPRTQSLTAKNFSEERRKMANERGLATNLAKARAVRAQKALQGKTTKPTKVKTAPKSKKTA